MTTDPIHYVEKPERREAHGGELVEDKPGWYFWDETWADRHGPFPTKDEAQKALKQYVDNVLGV